MKTATLILSCLGLLFVASCRDNDLNPVYKPAQAAAVMAGTDNVAAVKAAYEAVPAKKRADLELNRAYVRRMVELGMPEEAYDQAQLVVARSQDALAWAVIGLVQARDAQMDQAMSSLSRAVRLGPTEPFVVRTMAQLAAWYDQPGRPVMPPDVSREFAAARGLVSGQGAFRDAYAEAQDAYAELAAAEDLARQQPPEAGAQPAPNAMEPPTDMAGPADPVYPSEPVYVSEPTYITEPVVINNYYDGPDWWGSCSYEPVTYFAPSDRHRVIFIGAIRVSGVRIGYTHGCHVVIDHARRVVIGHASVVVANQAREVVIRDARRVVVNRGGAWAASSAVRDLAVDAHGSVMAPRQARASTDTRRPGDTPTPRGTMTARPSDPGVSPVRTAGPAKTSALPPRDVASRRPATPTRLDQASGIGSIPTQKPAPSPVAQPDARRGDPRLAAPSALSVRQPEPPAAKERPLPPTPERRPADASTPRERAALPTPLPKAAPSVQPDASRNDSRTSVPFLPSLRERVESPRPQSAPLPMPTPRSGADSPPTRTSPSADRAQDRAERSSSDSDSNPRDRARR